MAAAFALGSLIVDASSGSAGKCRERAWCKRLRLPMTCVPSMHTIRQPLKPHRSRERRPKSIVLRGTAVRTFW
eukprot:4739568-Prymnesium_polylepis.1